MTRAMPSPARDADDRWQRRKPLPRLSWGWMAGLVAVTIGAQTQHPPAPPHEGPPRPTGYRIAINHASLGDLSLLPGIGPTLALYLDDHRQARGPFPDLASLGAVPRIGPVTLQRIEPWVRFDEPGDSAMR